MKGKSTFTSKEIDELKHLINIKNSLASDEQKSIRNKMRKMHFYITDFTSTGGFEVSDLQELIERGIIEVVDSSNTGKADNEVKDAHYLGSQHGPTIPAFISLSSFDQTFIEKNGFAQHIAYQEFKNDSRAVRKIPDIKGLYIVISATQKKEFLPLGTGGYFKEKNPNVPVKLLEENWIDNTNILYIGKAGGVTENGTESTSTLRKRLNTYFRFGSGQPVGHWGGRYIWQLKHPDDLIFFWRTCDESENPVILEHALIEEFRNHYGRFPFANLKA